MTRALKVAQCAPGVVLEDQGRAGYLDSGLSRGGAMDLLALHEGAALLDQSPTLAALEMAGAGGVFEATADLRIALTGAEMNASLGGAPLVWNASCFVPAGARISIGGATAGNYGYLHVGGGFNAELALGSRSAHLAAGIGGTVSPGDALPVGEDEKLDFVGRRLALEPRLDGGVIMIIETPQSAFFSAEERERFAATEFRRGPRANRMGVQLVQEGDGFVSEAGLSALSEVVTPGDIQITGDGSPFLLMAECQTTGGYPRIGTAIPSDLPRIAQAGPNSRLTFRFISVEEALERELKSLKERAALRAGVTPLLRRPEDVPNLLSYQLISGVTAGDDLERDPR